MSKQPDSEWTTVTEGAATQVKFDKIGDVFIGTKVGKRTIDPQNGKDDPFDVWEFHAAEQPGLSDGELVNVPTSYGLRDLENVPDGTLCRLEYVKDIPTARGLNPMKSFIIQTKS